MALFTAVWGWIGLWRVAILLILGLVWPWPIAAYLGFDSYTLAIGFYLSAWTTVAFVAGLVWGSIARRTAAGGIVLIVVTLVPWIAGSIVLLEMQRVPDATCAKEVEFRIGTLRLEVPRDLGIRSVTTDGAPKQAWEGFYSNWPGAKPDVRALCHATEGGRAPVTVSHVWFSYRWFRQELDAACESGTGFPRLEAACGAAARTEPTVVQLYARPDGLPTPSLSHFNTRLITEAQSAGEPEGYRCNDSMLAPLIRYCTIWYQLTPEVLVVSSVKLGPSQDDEDPLADTIILLDALMRRLASG